MDIVSDYLKDNQDIQDFINKVSDNTGEKLMSVWVSHIKENCELFKKKGWATIALQGEEKNKTAIVCGSSPAIHSQIETLKDVQHDTDFVLCALSSNLAYLLNNGIIPKYCIVVDADKSTGDDWEKLDTKKTKKITLISALHAYPPMLKKWEGPLYFLDLQSDDEKLDSLKEKLYGPLNAVGSGFPAIFAQFNIMVAAAYLILECPIIIMVGHELSFKDKDAQYYVDRKDFRDNEKRFPHGDIYGNKVHTTVNLLAVKYGLEGFLELLSGNGWFFNCTEAGIFGITKKFNDRHIPWIHQLTLKDGISQARVIMRTGQPLYE